MKSQTHSGFLDRLLRIFTDVRPGEGLTALLLALNVFLILEAYYVLKPVREALILSQGSAELKSYLAAGQVLLLAMIVPLYGRLVSKFSRRRLINLVTAFFVTCLVVFFVLGRAGVPLGVPFFIWIGIFNLMIPAQFWSFANDIYSKEEGERLFPIVGFGASLGAVVGATQAHRLIGAMGIYQLMLVGAALLAIQVLVTNYLDRREYAARASSGQQAALKQPAAEGRAGGAFSLVFRTRYLLMIGIVLMLLNWVNTTGEYILGSVVKAQAVREVAAGQAGGLSVEKYIGATYAEYFGMVNLIGLLLQLFVVSRVVKYLGVGLAVAILPCISILSYNVLAFYPLLRIVLAAKVAENSTDYSLNNTVRHMLFLPCTREQKYSAKQAIDSFFVRFGDVLSALLVFVGTTYLALSPRGFALANVGLAVIWLFLAILIGRQYRELVATGRPPGTIEISESEAEVGRARTAES